MTDDVPNAPVLWTLSWCEKFNSEFMQIYSGMMYFAIISRTSTEAKEHELPPPNSLVHEFSFWIISK